jgi:hypothetical protein
MGSPEDVIATYSDHRARQQRPDDVTREAYDYITSEPAIKAILAGHIHGDHFEDAINDRLTQYTIGTCTARRISLPAVGTESCTSPTRDWPQGRSSRTRCSLTPSEIP